MEKKTLEEISLTKLNSLIKDGLGEIKKITIIDCKSPAKSFYEKGTNHHPKNIEDYDFFCEGGTKYVGGEHTFRGNENSGQALSIIYGVYLQKSEKNVESRPE